MCNSAPTPVHTVTHTQVQCCRPFQQLHSIFGDFNNNTASLSVPEMEGIYATGGASFFDSVPLVEFMDLVGTRMPGESYRQRLGSLLLCSCDIVQALINSLVC